MVGLILLGVVARLTDLAMAQCRLWIPTLLWPGLAFGTFGVIAGAIAREARRPY